MRRQAEGGGGGPLGVRRCLEVVEVGVLSVHALQLRLEAADLLPHPAHAGLLVLERAAQILERLATQRRT